jgi:CopG family nickel-responsive transcriptional regulator
MPRAERFTVSMEGALLRLLDRYLDELGYSSRSEGIRDLIRERLVQKEWEDPRADAVGVITLVYDHHRRELPDRLTSLQHEFYKEVVSTTHIHLDKHNCLEVVIVKGKAARIRKIANRLTCTKGVKHGRFVTTTAGKSLR